MLIFCIIYLLIGAVYTYVAVTDPLTREIVREELKGFSKPFCVAIETLSAIGHTLVWPYAIYVDFIEPEIEKRK